MLEMWNRIKQGLEFIVAPALPSSDNATIATGGGHTVHHSRCNFPISHASVNYVHLHLLNLLFKFLVRGRIYAINLNLQLHQS